MNESELTLSERIAGIQRVINYLRKQQNEMFSKRSQQPKAYQLIVNDISEAKKRIQKLKARLRDEAVHD